MSIQFHNEAELLEALALVGVTPDSAADTVTPVALTTRLTSLTHHAPSTPDYAIAQLTNSSPYGFVASDEGETVLKVLANLQTRVNEMETQLIAAGILA